MKSNDNNVTNNAEADDDVVVIEQRDNKTLIYIAVAGVIGIALGGLIGGYIATNHWQSKYAELENSLGTIQSANSELADQSKSQMKEQLDSLTQEWEQKLDEQKAASEKTIQELKAQNVELEKMNTKLHSQLSEQKTELATTEKKNQKLSRQNNIQASVFERSKQLFAKEEKVKKELADLQAEKKDLQDKLVDLKKECDLYLSGTSWDARSNACSLQDSSNARLSEVNQLIKVHQMDLKEINALNDELGL